MKRGIAIMFVLVLSLTMLATLPTGCKAPATGSKNLKIGSLFAYTGPAASLFADFKKTLDMQAEQVNAAGGVTVGGQKYNLVMVHEDNQMSVDGAVAGFRKLIYQDGVKFLLGPAVPFLCPPIADEREQQKILEFDCTSTFDTIKGHGQYCFKPHGGGNLAHQAMEAWAAENLPDVKKFAAIGPNNISGKDAWDQTKLVLSRFPSKSIVAEEFYDPATTDFAPILTRLLRSNPDIIDTCESENEPQMMIMKQARDLGYKGWFTCGFFVTPQYTVEGVGRNYAYNIVYEAMEWNYAAQPAERDFAAQYKAKYGALPGGSVCYIYDHLPTMLKAIQDAGTISDTTKVVKTIEAWKSFELKSGTATWGGLQTTGYKHVAQPKMWVTVCRSADKWEGYTSPTVVCP